VPGVGALFRRQNDSMLREEIIVLLTPHIIKDDAVYSEESLKALDRLDAMRVGLRRGLMPWGRERLSEGYYETAMRELAKPNPSSSTVLFNLNAATNLNPAFVEAIELKRQVTGKVVSSINSSATHQFVRDVIRKEMVTSPTTAPVEKLLTPRPLSSAKLTTTLRPMLIAGYTVGLDLTERATSRIWNYANDSIAWVVPTSGPSRQAIVQLDAR